MKNLLFKVQVTPEQSTAIQQAVFKKGGSWSSGKTVVVCQFCPFLVLKKGCLTNCKDEDDFYKNHGDVKQVFARDALALIESATSIKPVFIVDLRGGEVAVRENTPVRPAVLNKDTPGIICLWILGETTFYSKKLDDTTHYGNEYREGILETAHKLCERLNEEGDEKEV